MQDIFTFEQQGIDQQGNVIGQLASTGIVPSFTDKFAMGGINLDDMGLGFARRNGR
jgi:pilus assembly protein CpaF